GGHLDAVFGAEEGRCGMSQLMRMPVLAPRLEAGPGDRPAVGLDAVALPGLTLRPPLRAVLLAGLDRRLPGGPLLRAQQRHAFARTEEVAFAPAFQVGRQHLLRPGPKQDCPAVLLAVVDRLAAPRGPVDPHRPGAVDVAGAQGQRLTGPAR